MGTTEKIRKEPSKRNKFSPVITRLKSNEWQLIRKKMVDKGLVTKRYEPVFYDASVFNNICNVVDYIMVKQQDPNDPWNYFWYLLEEGRKHKKLVIISINNEKDLIALAKTLPHQNTKNLAEKVNFILANTTYIDEHTEGFRQKMDYQIKELMKGKY